MNEHDALLDQYSVQRFCEITAGRHGLSVVYDDDEVMPRTDGKTIWLPSGSKNNSVTRGDLDLTKYIVLHECYHLSEGSDFDLMRREKIDVSTIPGSLLNLIEDHRVDRSGSTRYEGDSLVYNKSYPALMDKWLDSMGSYKAKSGGALPEGLEQIVSVVNWEVDCRGSWLPASMGISSKLSPLLSEKGEGWLKKLREGDYVSDLNNMESTEDAWELVKRICKEVLGIKNPEEEAKGKNGNKGKGKDGKSSPDDDSSSEGEGEGTGEGEEGGEEGSETSHGKEEGEGSEEKDSKEKEGGKPVKSKPKSKKKIKYHEFVPTSTHGEESMLGTGHGRAHDYSEYKSSGKKFIPVPYRDIPWFDYSSEKGYGGMGRTSCEGRPSYLAESEAPKLHESIYRDRYAEHGKGLAQRVRKLLQVRSQARYQLGQKKGKINRPSLHKICVPDQKEYRVFKRKIESTVLDSAVQIIIDCSGSMNGSKYASAVRTAELLNDAISTSLRIPTEIVGFTHWTGSSRMLIFKPFSKQVPTNKLHSDMISAARFLGDNADGEALNWAYQRIRVRKEKRRLMIVLSDGSPAARREGSIYDYTKEIVQAIEKSPIDIIGIGIQSDSVNEFYKTRVVISEASELEGALLKIIESRLT